MSDTTRRVYGLSRPWEAIIAWFPGISSLILGVMLAVPATHARAMGMLKEDRLVENLTFIAYFVASGFCVAWVRRLLGRGAWLRAVAAAGLGCVCFGLGMEEISWGERVLHFRIPDLILKNNVQHEPTIHNLAIFHDASVWIPLVFAVAALLAIALHTRARRDTSGLPSPLLPYAVVVLLLSGYDNFTSWTPLDTRFDTLVALLGEHVEMLVSFGFALGVVLAMRRERLRDLGGTPSTVKSGAVSV